MRITDLKQQVNHPSRYSVYVDGKFSFGLSADAVLGSGIVVGEILDETRLEELRSLSADDKSYNNTLRYVTMRQHSEWEVVQYLQRKKVGKRLAAEIIDRLKDLDLLNDANFARSWVANRRLLKATNKRRLAQELRQKRVSDAVIDSVLAEDETDDTAVLRELVAKKRQLPRYRDDDMKLMQYLARQGYSYDAIKSVLHKTDLD
jgi:regulatory protein